MPLHLLGKKSWNVYNADNIERVRRDEAAAKAKEEAEEQRMQQIDAERRLAILRGEEPPPLPPAENHDTDTSRTRETIPGRERKKRKRTGEDDTDFELRIAKERSVAVQPATETARKTSSAPIVDRLGHIDLFGDEGKRQHEKNPEAEAEKAKKKREYEDQFTMRFTNAAGKDGMQGPWYAKAESRAEGADVEFEAPSKDVWGNEDPGRRKREADRIVSSDPLAMMKSGAARVREVKKERLRLQEERDKELRQLIKEERRREKRARREVERGRDDRRHSRRHSNDDDSRRHRRRRDDEPRSREDEISSRRVDRSTRRSGEEDSGRRRHHHKNED